MKSFFELLGVLKGKTLNLFPNYEEYCSFLVTQLRIRTEEMHFAGGTEIPNIT